MIGSMISMWLHSAPQLISGWYGCLQALKASGLQALGYQYVNLDAGWSLRDRDNSTGRVRPDPKIYPNIANGGLAKFLESQVRACVLACARGVRETQ